MRIITTTFLSILVPVSGLLAQEKPQMHTKVGVGLTTMYFFRGILQQDGGLIVQPSVEIYRDGMDLFDRPLTWRMGLWNSLHENQTPPNTGQGNKAWYEAQFYTGVDVGVTEDVTVGMTYAALDPTNGSFRINNTRGRPTTQELRFKGAWNDPLGDPEGTFKGLFPYAELVFELAGGRDFGNSLGTYLEIGAKPAIRVTDDIDLHIPLRLGLSLKDYYEIGNNDDTFGFFSFGGEATVPLAGDDSKFGPWKLRAALEAYILGDNLELFNKNDSFDIVGSVNLMLTF